MEGQQQQQQQQLSPGRQREPSFLIASTGWRSIAGGASCFTFAEVGQTFKVFIHILVS